MKTIKINIFLKLLESTPGISPVITSPSIKLAIN